MFAMAKRSFEAQLEASLETLVVSRGTAIHEDPGFPLPYRCLAACYAHMGQRDDAGTIVKRLRAISPVVVPDASFRRNAGHRELLLSGLRLAAGEAK